jgi:hypothetical protein
MVVERGWRTGEIKNNATTMTLRGKQKTSDHQTIVLFFGVCPRKRFISIHLSGRIVILETILHLGS